MTSRTGTNSVWLFKFSRYLGLYKTIKRYVRDDEVHHILFSNGLKAIQKIHVNLVDLVDTSGQDIELFLSLEDLRDYTIETAKFFPKESAYAGGVLKFLLREIL